jgi:hypothetical protein
MALVCQQVVVILSSCLANPEIGIVGSKSMGLMQERALDEGLQSESLRPEFHFRQQL